MARSGCCIWTHFREDNARFVLLALVMVIYMLVGASVFMVLEQDKEVEDRNFYFHSFNAFLTSNPDVNRTELEALLEQHADAAAAGLLNDKRRRWDFAGSFYFVGTVVSTIGKLTPCSPRPIYTGHTQYPTQEPAANTIGVVFPVLFVGKSTQMASDARYIEARPR